MPTHARSCPQPVALLLLCFLALPLGLILVAAPVHAQSVEAQLAQAQTLMSRGRLDDAQAILRRIPPADDSEVIGWIESRAERLHAVLLFELSNRLLARDPAAAMKWMFVGWSWGVYDAMRCKDKTAHGAGMMVGGMARETYTYSRAHQKEAMAALEQALAWGETRPSPASPQWLCVHGMQSVQAALEGRQLLPADVFVNRAEWPRVHSEARQLFRTSIPQMYAAAPKPPAPATPPAQADNPSGFRIVEANPESTPGPGNLFWLDNSRVLFDRAEPGHFCSAQEAQGQARRRTLSLWAVGGDVQPIAQIPWTGHYCASPQDGYIRYQTTATKDTDIGKEGRFGSESEYHFDLSSGLAPLRHPLTCRVFKRLLLPGNRIATPLLPGHGQILGTLQALEYLAPGNDVLVVLPFGPAAVGQSLPGFYAFKGAYFFWDHRWGVIKSDAQTQVDHTNQYVASGCKKAWWLFPDGRTEELCIPYVPKADGKGFGVVPTARGLLVVSGTQSAAWTGPAGAYLATSQGLEKILTGWIDARRLAVSPDGCKVAMVFAPSETAARDIGPGRRTLRVADVCSPGSPALKATAPAPAPAELKPAAPLTQPGAAAAGTPPTAPQTAPDCSEFTTLPPVGSWVEHRGTDPRSGESGLIRMAIVAEEMRRGNKYLRMETQVQEKTKRIIMQFLMASDPNAPIAVVEGVIKQDNQPAMKVPGEVIGMMQGPLMMHAREKCKAMTLVGEETITVPAGTFKVKHY